MDVEHLRRAARLGDDTALRPERFGALAYDFDTRRLSFVRRRSQARGALNEEFERGLDAPICLTWELTYACNLACVHCLSSLGPARPARALHRRVHGGDRRARADAGLLREHRRRRADGPQDFWELVEYATAHDVGVKFSTNGSRIDADAGGVAARRATTSTCRSRSTARPPRSTTACAVSAPTTTAIAAMRHLPRRDARTSSSRVVVTRENVGQLDAFKAIADRYRRAAAAHAAAAVGARRGRVGRAAPDRGASSASSTTGWLAHGEKVLTGDSFFHLARARRALPGLNLCGAGRVVCLIDPIGDVYACPFAIHETFLAGNVREPGGFARVWRESELFLDAAQAADRRRVRVVLVLRRVPRRLHGGEVLHRAAARRSRPRVRARARRDALLRGGATPKPSDDHSRVQRPRAAATRARSPTSTARPV